MSPDDRVCVGNTDAILAARSLNLTFSAGIKADQGAIPYKSLENLKVLTEINKQSCKWTNATQSLLFLLEKYILLGCVCKRDMGHIRTNLCCSFLINWVINCNGHVENLTALGVKLDNA